MTRNPNVWERQSIDAILLSHGAVEIGRRPCRLQSLALMKRNGTDKVQEAGEKTNMVTLERNHNALRGSGTFRFIVQFCNKSGGQCVNPIQIMAATGKANVLVVRVQPPI